jgi:tetratricopeptide (TPR) repeat protein
MGKLVGEHPAFQQPDTSHPNPVLAEQFYGKGLHQYWSRNYGEAEALFKQAIQYYNQDARYQYYLGLSLLGQKGNVKRDAANFALEQAARLEAGNRPSMAEVNASLERLQGPMRAYVDSYRQKAVSAAN